MRSRKTFLALVMMLCVSLWSCSRQGAGPVAVAAPAINFTLENTLGQEVRLSDYEGKKPVLLIFWASWCPPCVAEIPDVIRLRERIHPDKLEILAVNVQEPMEQVASFAKQKGINYTVLVDEEGEVAYDYEVYGIPTLILIDRDGRMIHRGHGLGGGFDKLIAEAADV